MTQADAKPSEGARMSLPLPWPFRDRPPVVPVLRLAGVIGASGGFRSATLNNAALERAIDAAFAVRRAPAVALAINSPGGSPSQSTLIADRIRRLADAKNRPVIAFVEDVGASGGYWLACAADEIYATPSSIVGSIGVISAGFGFHQAIARLGIERRVHTAGRDKAMLDPFSPQRPEDITRLRAIQDEIHDAFKTFIATRRGTRIKLPEEDLFSGQVWTGHKALEAGLIDGIGDMHGVLRARFGDRLRTRLMNAPRGWFWQRRFTGDGRATAPELRIVDHLLERIEERALFARYGL